MKNEKADMAAADNVATGNVAADKARLKAQDAEDLAVISALLQDATTCLKEMVFDPKAKRFAGLFERFRREHQDDWESCDGLTCCDSALVLDGIEDAKYRGLVPDDLEKQYTLLTIATAPGRDHLIHIDLVFDGEVEIQLRTNAISCILEDVGELKQPKMTPCDHFKALVDSAVEGDGS